MRRLAAVPFRDPAEWSLSLQINNLRCKPLIWAPVHGRYDDFLRSHHNLLEGLNFPLSSTQAPFRPVSDLSLFISASAFDFLA